MLYDDEKYGLDHWAGFVIITIIVFMLLGGLVCSSCRAEREGEYSHQWVTVIKVDTIFRYDRYPSLLITWEDEHKITYPEFRTIPCIYVLGYRDFILMKR